MILRSLTHTLVFALTFIYYADCGFAPALPTGRRTQYYYRYEDGGYKYGYDTGKGSYSKAIASPDNEVEGGYSYDSPGGRVDVKYTAGKAGFLPEGLPSQGVASLKHTAGVSSPSHYYNAQHQTVSHYPTEQDLAAEQGPADASYSFSYNVGDQSRQEVSDPHGNIQGSYSYISKDGATRKIDYEAGAEKGFVVKGITPIRTQQTGTAQNGLAAAPGTVLTNPDGSYSFSYTTEDHARQESSDSKGNVAGSFSFVAKDDGINRHVNYEAGAEKGFIVSGTHLPQPVQPLSIADGHTVNLEKVRIHGGYSGISAGDGSSQTGGNGYSFSYNAGDHARHESSDAHGNVVGSFSFVAKDDKISRKVDYTSSADKGFVAIGKHLPATNTPTTYSPAVHSNIHGPTSPKLFVPSGFSHQSHYHSSAIEPHHPNTSGVPDGSYSFSYSAGDHSRTENADAHGNVVGSLTFTPRDDAIPRKLDYEAEAKKGFIARGEYLPKVPSAQVPAILASSGNPISGVSGETVSTNYVHSSAGGNKVGEADGSYTFGFNAGDHSRQESSDTSGNIRGSYTYISKEDGLQRKVNYEAGTKGFIATGEHLPLQPHVLAPEILISKPEDQTAGYDDKDATNRHSDASYSFSYDAGDHSRQESSDPYGNIVGSFSFVAKDDGLQRKVNYEAGAEKGFITKGTHLLKPVSAGNALAYTAEQHPSNVASGASHIRGTQGSGHSTGTHHTGGSNSNSFRNSYEDRRAHVKTFLTPNAHHKFGYIYDTK